MAEITLNVESGRPLGTRPSGRLRTAGKIPGVVYGHGMAPMPVAIGARDLRAALTTEAGLNALLSLKIGDTTHLADREVAPAPPGPPDRDPCRLPGRPARRDRHRRRAHRPRRRGRGRPSRRGDGRPGDADPADQGEARRRSGRDRGRHLLARDRRLAARLGPASCRRASRPRPTRRRPSSSPTRRAPSSPRPSRPRSARAPSPPPANRRPLPTRAESGQPVPAPWRRSFPLRRRRPTKTRPSPTSSLSGLGTRGPSTTARGTTPAPGPCASSPSATPHGCGGKRAQAPRRRSFAWPGRRSCWRCPRPT